MTNERHEQRRVEFNMDQLEVIALAHTVNDFLGSVIESKDKLSFEQANSYFTSWHAMRSMLLSIDREYLAQPQHREMADFFLGKGRAIAKRFASHDLLALRKTNTYQVEAHLFFGKDVIQVFNDEVRAENAFRSLQPVRDIARSYGLEVILLKHEQDHEHEQEDDHANGLMYIGMNGAMVKRGECKAVLVQAEQKIPGNLEGSEDSLKESDPNPLHA